jgi:hypothetical protein
MVSTRKSGPSGGDRTVPKDKSDSPVVRSPGSADREHSEHRGQEQFADTRARIKAHITCMLRKHA